MAEEEGVIKYQLEFQDAEPLLSHDFSDLTRWHHRFKTAGILGQDPGRYEGYGFGNISQRLADDTFVISGTQTGNRDTLAPGDYAHVLGADIEHNLIEAEGRIAPSSEALSHAAIYALSSEIRFVFHVHSPRIWQTRHMLGLPETSADVPYGTPQMAREIRRLYEEGPLQSGKVLAMAGHDDGIIGFGRAADEAGEAIMRLLASDE